MGQDIEVLVDDAVFPESPRWRDGALWYSDIGAGQICRVSGAGAKEIIVSGLDTPSGLGWTRSGDLLVTSLLEAGIFRIGADMTPRLFCGRDRHGVDGTNDMATVGSRSYVTCSGRRYQMGDDLEALSQPVGKILIVEHDSGACRTVADGLKGPNGVAVTPDGGALIVAEGFASRILEFDIEADGSLANSRIFAETDHMLDGLALDAEGAAWVATGANFQRIERGGRVADVVEVPGWMCIAPMLGGADGRDLFMAVCLRADADDIFTGKARGRLVTTRVAVPAAP